MLDVLSASETHTHLDLAKTHTENRPQTCSFNDSRGEERVLFVNIRLTIVGVLLYFLSQKRLL